MYDVMTTTDLIATATLEAHPDNAPSAEHAELIDELALRLNRLDAWHHHMRATVNQYLVEDDGSDLIPDHARVSNMLERLIRS